MKKKKWFLTALTAFVAAVAIFCTACVTVPDAPPFINPGDSLGGGGTGEIAGEADSNSDSVKDDVIGNSDLDDLSKNTESDNAQKKDATSEIVEITESGDYYFKGNYGGIHISKKELTLHFIFDGVTIINAAGVAIDGTDYKKTDLTVTLNEGTVNTVTNDVDNAIHIKGSLAVNGKGTLNVVSNGKSAVKASKEIKIVDATLNLKAANHAVSALAVIAANCTVNVEAAGKDGINAECDDETTEFTTDEGYVSLTNVNYSCDVSGDGIQADTVVYINGGTYDIKTTGNFVPKTQMAQYGMAADDFKFILSNGKYVRIASDETGRYSTSNLYGLSQGCKGIKAGEIEYPDPDNADAEITVTKGDYLINIVDGTFAIDSTDDSIHANSGNVLIEGGTFTLSTLDDAITSDKLTKITGGNITINASYEGIEGGYVEISGGTINVTASDDGINAASDDNSVVEHIIISGGTVTVDAAGDGIDSNGSILISGGTVTVHGPTSGRDAGLDADRGIVITGGTVFASSSLGMVETPSTNSTQYVISYAHQSTISAGSTVSLCDKDGVALVTVTVKKNCQSIIISSPDIKNGGTYSVYGGSTQMTSFTVSSIITTVGSSGSSFPGGGFGPGGRPGGR